MGGEGGGKKAHREIRIATLWGRLLVTGPKKLAVNVMRSGEILERFWKWGITGFGDGLKFGHQQKKGHKENTGIFTSAACQKLNFSWEKWDVRNQTKSQKQNMVFSSWENKREKSTSA